MAIGLLSKTSAGAQRGTTQDSIGNLEPARDILSRPFAMIYFNSNETEQWLKYPRQLSEDWEVHSLSSL